MGPEGGNGGGKVVASGTPEDIAAVKESFTGIFLKEELREIIAFLQNIVLIFVPKLILWYW
jgi:excinuclease ABC subunit A